MGVKYRLQDVLDDLSVSEKRLLAASVLTGVSYNSALVQFTVGDERNVLLVVTYPLASNWRTSIYVDVYIIWRNLRMLGLAS